MLNSVISVEAMRACEEAHFASKRTSSIELMHLAGVGCAEEFVKFASLYPKSRRVIIYIGKGNNGGDGVVMAQALAKLRSWEVILAMTNSRDELSASSRHYFDLLDKQVTVTDASTLKLQTHDMIIDALLGTGCRGAMKEPFKSLINYINASRLPVFSVDIPSGMGTDFAIQAELTAVIGYFKDILFTPEGIEKCGRLRKVKLPLTLDEKEFAGAPQAFDLENFQATTLPMARTLHKYSRGHVLICGGSREFRHAPFLTARSALRSGAGMVHLATPFAVTPGSGTLAAIPVECADLNGSLCAASLEKLEKILAKVDVIAAGPGMGRSEAAGEFIKQLLTVEKPLILDADAIFLASQHLDLLRKRRAPAVLTPHRGEAIFLAKAGNLELTGEDLTDAKFLAKATNAIILLKGARTVIADPAGKCFINTSGTPALATAGSGDCLTGLIAAEIAALNTQTEALQRELILTSAARSAFLHGLAGEFAEQTFSSCGVIADDLADCIARSRALIRHQGDIF